MEQKKSSQARLERHSATFFGMGLVLALSIALTAFEWNSKPRVSVVEPIRQTVEEDIDIASTSRIPEPPKPKIEAPQVVMPDYLVITDDKVEQPTIVSTEDVPDGSVSVVPDLPACPKYEEKEVMNFAEVMPSFNGGTSALMQFLNESIKYPQSAIDNGEHGRVICTFVVEKDGTITDVRIVKGVSPSLDKEATRVIQMMPKWTPGFQNGVTVRVSYTLPIIFRMSN